MALGHIARRTEEPDPRSLEVHQVESARAGDPDAFRWLFERRRLAVYGFLLDLLRNADAAREATQETFVRVHRQLGSLRDAAAFGPWLFGVARRVSLEQARLARRQTTGQALGSSVEIVGGLTAGERVVDDATAVHDGQLVVDHAATTTGPPSR